MIHTHVLDRGACGVRSPSTGDSKQPGADGILLTTRARKHKLDGPAPNEAKSWALPYGSPRKPRRPLRR